MSGFGPENYSRIYTGWSKRDDVTKRPWPQWTNQRRAPNFQLLLVGKVITSQRSRHPRKLIRGHHQIWKIPKVLKIRQVAYCKSLYAVRFRNLPVGPPPKFEIFSGTMTSPPLSLSSHIRRNVCVHRWHTGCFSLEHTDAIFGCFKMAPFRILSHPVSSS